MALVAALLAPAAAPALAETDHAAIAERALSSPSCPASRRWPPPPGAGGRGGRRLRGRRADRRGAGQGGLRQGLRRLGRDRPHPLRPGARRTAPASPSSSGRTPRAPPRRRSAAMIAAEDPVVDDPAAFGAVSVAARGLMALDWLLYDPAAGADRGGRLPLPAAGGDHPRHGGDGGADAGALARSVGGHPDQRRGAGQPGLSRAGRGDARALLGAGRRRCRRTSTCGWGGRSAPSTSRSRGGPRRGGRGGRCRTWWPRCRGCGRCGDACSRRRSGRSEAEGRRGVRGGARRRGRVGEPIDAAVATTPGRVRVESLQGAVGRVQDEIAEHVGPTVGVTSGFNSMDGD